LPEITRALLYPYRRLIPVRAAASEAGYQGGMFPWKSGSDEEALLAGGHAASSSPH
jgi:trehalose/maltose hydrolase-like predicted phosphorylase